MPRTTRIIIPEIAHHIIHRGNNRQDVFFDDQALHCESAKEHVVATGHVPHGIANE